MFAAYDLPPHLKKLQYRKKPADEGGGYTISIRDIAANWGLIDNDLADIYGIDVWDYELMITKPWPWLKHRINGLLSEDSRIARWAQNRSK